MSRIQQQQPTSLMSQYYNTVIPQTMQGQGYPHANTVVFDDTANHTKEDIIIVDSRYRNWDNETQSNYTFYLGQQFDYVRSIELVDGCVLCSNYVINSDNNLLTFVEKKKQITIEIPVGIYTIDQLCTQISTLMTNESTHSYTYECLHDPLTDKITIQLTDISKKFELIWSDGTEILEDNGVIETLVIDPVTHKKTTQRVSTGRTRQSYRSNSVGSLLGFLPINLSGSHAYTGQQVYNLYPDEYLALHVTTDNNDDCKNVVSQTNMIGNNGAFAILDLSQSPVRPHGVYNRQYTALRRFTRVFNPPIKFTRLRIEIKKPDGLYYDFHGLDHYLFFIVQRVYDRKLINPANQML